MYANELPFRKKISAIDEGCTRGPSSSSGVIMSALDFDLKDLPISKFKAMLGKVVEINDEV